MHDPIKYQASKKFIVYALRDPHTNEVRYVGKSSTGLRRLSTFFDSYSTSLLNLSSPQTLSSNVRALMLMGYLIRCNEVASHGATVASA